MNWIIPCLIAALTRSAIRKTARKNKQQNKQKHEFFTECAERRGNETQILTTHKTFMKTHIVQQTKHQLRHHINGKIVFELQGIRWNLSMMRINYKFTKRTKPEKYEKISDKEKIVNFNAIRYKLSALSNIIHSILI